MTFNVGEVPYVKTKFTGLDGKTKVGWSEENSDFEVRADSSGVFFKGTMKSPVANMTMLQDFAELVTEAWKEHSRLVPKLTTHFSEPADPTL